MRSIIALPTNYVVVDLETTGCNPQQDAIIEISAIRYLDGKEAGRFDQLVSIDFPIPAFVSMLTGITDEMLAGKPNIYDVLPAFAEFIGDDILIGHNIAAFDSCFLARAYREYLNRELANSCVDTLRLSKKINPSFPRHSLENLALHYNVSYRGAHRGLRDCLITNACYQHMRDEVFQTCGEEAFIRQATQKARIDVHSILPEEAITDESHPFYQKVLVFTGALSLTRQEAMQLSVNVGAIVKTSVTTKTSYLIVGGQDLARVGDDGMSTKEEKAHALNSSGKANIKIISENEFMDLVTK